MGEEWHDFSSLKMRFLNCMERKSPPESCCKPSNKGVSAALRCRSVTDWLPWWWPRAQGVQQGPTAGDTGKRHILAEQSRAGQGTPICGEQFASSCLCYLLTPAVELVFLHLSTRRALGSEHPWPVLVLTVSRGGESILCFFFTPTTYCSGMLRLSCCFTDSRWS